MSRANREGAIILVTGPPGVGKTTVIARLYEHYSKRGLKVGGMITAEVRKEGERIGFKLKDLSTDNEGWLAVRGNEGGPRIGRYSVVTKDLEEIGVKALAHSLRDSSLVLVDEIGPMEMTSPAFARALSQLVNSGKFIVATVRLGSHYKEVDQALQRKGSRVIHVTRENRDRVVEDITVELDKLISAPED